MSADDGQPPQPLFFATPAEFRTWMAQHHTERGEVVIGFYKKGSGQPSLTWPESVDVALCYGWIDGRGKSIDEQRYMIRFTPRKPSSIWSAVNIARVQELEAQGLMHDAGRAAFERRREDRSRVYSHEQESVEMPEPYEQQLQQHAAAWAFFSTQAPSYQKAARWWVASAKAEATRAKRLAQLIDDSASGQRLAHLSRRPKAAASKDEAEPTEP